MDLRTGASAAVVLTSGFYYSYIKTVDVKAPPISFNVLNKVRIVLLKEHHRTLSILSIYLSIFLSFFYL